jgi:hypothetical protein
MGITQYTTNFKNQYMETLDILTLHKFTTIKLGTFQNLKDIKTALHVEGMKIKLSARQMLNQEAFTIANDETEVDLMVITGSDLGFTGATMYSDICEGAIALGLQLCPAEVGPQLRLQYRDQLENKPLFIAMEAIVDSINANIFKISHDDTGMWLSWSYGFPDSRFPSDYRFVFVRPRK